MSADHTAFRYEMLNGNGAVNFKTPVNGVTDTLRTEPSGHVNCAIGILK